MSYSYTGLKLAVEHDVENGRTIIGTFIEKAFVPVAVHKLGHVLGWVESAEKSGATVPTPTVDAAVEGVPDRMTSLETSVASVLSSIETRLQALEAKVSPPASSTSTSTTITPPATTG